MLASLNMIVGHEIIAVPTGIVTVEISNALRKSDQLHVCSRCTSNGRDADAIYCKKCGGEITPSGIV